MTRLRALLLVLLSAVVFAAWPGRAEAIPAFARAYGFNCTMCHSNFPRLNDFGSRFRDNGYQIPGSALPAETVLQGLPAVAMRTSGGYNFETVSGSSEVQKSNQFRVRGLDLLSAGLMGRNIGYVFVYPPKIQISHGVADQPGTVEMANVIFSNIGSSWLNVRAGRFEPAYVAFSVKRQLSFSPYDVYEFAFPSGIAFSETQNGVEVTGRGRGFRYAAGWLLGGPANRADDPPADFYFRAAHVFGPGDGQTAGQRIGVIAYSGFSRPEVITGTGDRKHFTRVGVDASLNYRQWNVALQYLRGDDDGSLWARSADASFAGGFAEVSYLPMTQFVGFVRFDWLEKPDFLRNDVSRWTAGGRYYFVDNVALHSEFSRRLQNTRSAGVADASEKFFTISLDFAF